MSDAPSTSRLSPTGDVVADPLFVLAPVSLWLENFEGVRRILGAWRDAGVTDIRAYLREDPRRVSACSAAIRIIDVNERTLELFEARSLAHLIDGIDEVFRDDMFEAHVEELAQLWDGKLRFSSLTVNYTLGGRRLDIQLSGRVMPTAEADWSRVLISIEDVTAREQAQRHAVKSEAYARGLFEHSPVSLWVEDFSAVKALVDEVRASGVIDFRVFTDVHPEFVARCLSEIRVIDVNSQTLTMFKAQDTETLLHRAGDIFRDEMVSHFKEQLIDLWDGRLSHHREVMNYTLDGVELCVHLQFSIFPGHEAKWDLVLVSLTDITARKKAEAYLEFLGKHDVTTRLYNRSYYVDELNRLERRNAQSVTIVVADLNGLKEVNDSLGHNAGDALLRRVGEVLNEAVRKPLCAARIGGDEFAVIIPGGTEADGQDMIETILNMIELNNQYYPGIPLRLAIGAATRQKNEGLEAVVSRADINMYAHKRSYYQGSGQKKMEIINSRESKANNRTAFS